MADSPQSMIESSATDSSSKHQKLSNEEAEFDNTIDRISSLPDSILCYILSFLPTICTVATSILSTRWKYLWTLVHNLDFDDAAVLNPVRFDRNRVGYMNFVNFVYRVLVLRNASSCIKKFRLKCITHCDSFHFNAWVCAAILRDVEELDLYMPFPQPVELPRRLYTCKMLKVLKLTQGIVLNVPSSVHFPTLKILHLIWVNYQNDDSARKLISGCPILQDLFIKRSARDNVRIFNISAPALKNLTIEVDILSHALNAHKLEINAPALEYLNLKDNMSEDISIENLSYLVEANLDVSRVPEDAEYYGNWVFKLLKGFSNVKYLSLSGTTMKSLGSASNDDLPMFHNLTQLEMGIRCCDWHLLSNLLERSHNLEVLTLKKSVIHPNGHESCSRWPQNVPKCLLLHLTTIDIKGFEDLEDELKLVKHILEDAEVLKIMNICCRYLTKKAKYPLLQKLSMFPRASKTCLLRFD